MKTKCKHLDTTISAFGPVLLHVLWKNHSTAEDIVSGEIDHSDLTDAIITCNGCGQQSKNRAKFSIQMKAA